MGLGWFISFLSSRNFFGLIRLRPCLNINNELPYVSSAKVGDEFTVRVLLPPGERPLSSAKKQVFKVSVTSWHQRSLLRNLVEDKFYVIYIGITGSDQVNRKYLKIEGDILTIPP